jgi:hypothetical protein
VTKPQFKHRNFCWICGDAVDLKNSETDEHGLTVHAECYSLKLTLAKGSNPLMVRKPAHRAAALWYLLAGPVKRSFTR